MQKIQDQDNKNVLLQWKQVCDEFKQFYSLEEFRSSLENCQCKIENNTATIIARTRFQKERLTSEYKQNLKMFWYTINTDIREVEIVLKRRKEEGGNEPIADIIQLPLWPEATRGVPNSAVRGSLFAAIAPNKRKALERETITNEKDLRVILTGWQLDQGDKDVWEQALHMARQQPLGKEIYFSARGFLKALSRGTGKSQHEWLKISLARLGGCFVEITHRNYTYGGSLIEFEREEDTQLYKLSINPKIMKLYTAGWTQIDFEERKQIGNKKYLALWLHGYICSHVKIYPTKIETFLRLSGSINKDIYGFKRQLSVALEHLKSRGLIKKYNIDKKNLVYIEKYLSDSQKRYIEDKR